MGHKEWSEDWKTFTRCYTIASKCWDAAPLWTSGILLQYQSGLGKERNLCKGIVAFMVVRLKKSTSFIVQAIP